MYKIVQGSRGERRSFAVTVGLAEGYGPTAKTHTLEEVVSLVETYLKNKAASGESYLTGTITTGAVVYAWPEGPGKAGSGHEPNAIYSGEVSSLYNKDLGDDKVAEILNDLASELGSALGQTRIYVVYRDETWVLQREDTATPTGETVK